MLVKAGTIRGTAVYVETLQVRSIMGHGQETTCINVGVCAPGHGTYVNEAPEDVAALIELGKRVDILAGARIPGLSESAQAEVDRALGIKR